MKPRNKYEKRVADINATLLQDIAVKDIEWYKKASQSWDFGNGHFCYFTIYTNIKEFEIKRLYRGYKFTDKSTDHFFFVEIMREFNDGEKKTLFTKKRIAFGVTYFDTFSFSSEIELKRDYNNYAGNCLAYCFEMSCESLSEDNASEWIQCVQIDPKELGRVICNNPVAEKLY
jgi:hypothetical protein